MNHLVQEHAAEEERQGEEPLLMQIPLLSLVALLLQMYTHTNTYTNTNTNTNTNTDINTDRYTDTCADTYANTDINQEFTNYESRFFSAVGRASAMLIQQCKICMHPNAFDPGPCDSMTV